MSTFAIEAMSKSEVGDEWEGLGGACEVPKGARRSPLEVALPDDLLCAVLRHVINHKQGFRSLGTIQAANKLFRCSHFRPLSLRTCSVREKPSS